MMSHDKRSISPDSESTTRQQGQFIPISTTTGCDYKNFLFAADNFLQERRVSSTYIIHIHIMYQWGAGGTSDICHFLSFLLIAGSSVDQHLCRNILSCPLLLQGSYCKSVSPALSFYKGATVSQLALPSPSTRELL